MAVSCNTPSTNITLEQLLSQEAFKPGPSCLFTILSQMFLFQEKKCVFYPKRATLIQPKVCDQRLDFDNILISAFENFRPFEPN